MPWSPCQQPRRMPGQGKGQRVRRGLLADHFRRGCLKVKTGRSQAREPRETGRPGGDVHTVQLGFQRPTRTRCVGPGPRPTRRFGFMNPRQVHDGQRGLARRSGPPLKAHLVRLIASGTIVTSFVLVWPNWSLAAGPQTCRVASHRQKVMALQVVP